jgi:hypothetical protein
MTAKIIVFLQISKHSVLNYCTFQIFSVNENIIPNLFVPLQPECAIYIYNKV